QRSNHPPFRNRLSTVAHGGRWAALRSITGLRPTRLHDAHRAQGDTQSVEEAPTSCLTRDPAIKHYKSIIPQRELLPRALLRGQPNVRARLWALVGRTLRAETPFLRLLDLRRHRALRIRHNCRNSAA